MRQFQIRKMLWRRYFLVVAFLLCLLWPMRAYGKETEEAEQERTRLLSELHAQSMVLMDGESGRILLGKEEDVMRPMASTTKIMTCILALEKMEQENEIVTASKEAAAQPKVRLGVQEGEQFYLKDLLYSMMLESHNDSAVMIAEHIGGSIRGFASFMNQKAKEIGCTQTHYITPNGLDASDEGGKHAMTAEDLARVMRYCIQESSAKEAFLEITRESSHSFQDVSGKRSFSCTNHNAFLTMMEGALSGKTGFTADAGYCYVGALRQGERTFIVALLACGWPNHKNYKWQDTCALMKYGLQYYERKIFGGNVSLPKVLVKDGVPQDGNISGEAKVALTIEKKEYHCLLRKGEQLPYHLELKKALRAPVKKGTIVGKLQLLWEDQVLAEWNLQTKETVKQRDYVWCIQRVIEEFCTRNKKDQVK